MEPKDAATLRIRKLRKKLRQIEHLEGLDRDLTDEELNKVNKLYNRCLNHSQRTAENIVMVQAHLQV